MPNSYIGVSAGDASHPATHRFREGSEPVRRARQELQVKPCGNVSADTPHFGEDPCSDLMQGAGAASAWSWPVSSWRLGQNQRPKVPFGESDLQRLALDHVMACNGRRQLFDVMHKEELQCIQQRLLMAAPEYYTE